MQISVCGGAAEGHESHLPFAIVITAGWQMEFAC